MKTQCTFSLFMLITVMLNGVHIRVITEEGDFHTHPHEAGDVCRYVTVLAQMQGTHGLEYLALQEVSMKEWDDMKRFINTTVPSENVPRSLNIPDKKF